MIILGADQSFSSSGICVIENDEILHHSVYSSDKTKDIYDRSWDVKEYIVKIIVDFNVEMVNIEGLGFGSFGSATRDLAGLLFTIINGIKHIDGKDIKINIISPTSLKKFASGSGKSKKPQIFEALPEETKKIFKENYLKTKGLYDVTDAYWLSRYK